MVEISASSFKLKPAAHQVRGAAILLRKPRYGLFWEMRLRKTATIVTAADAALESGLVDVIVVTCPAQVKSVWVDPDLGEIRAHSKRDDGVFNYMARWEHNLEELNFNYCKYWVVTSFEFLRQENAHGDYHKVEALLEAIGSKKFWLVLDEASELGNYKSAQHRAVKELAAKASRVTLLDGTPNHRGQLQQYAKFGLLGQEVLGFKNYHQFAAVHGIKGGYKAKQVVGFRGQSEDLEFKGRDGVLRKYRSIDSKVKPFCEYLQRKDVSDMNWSEPERSFFTVALTPKTWGVYKQMRDEMLADLDSGKCLAQHASVRAMRLAQICAGFIGGVEVTCTADGIVTPSTLGAPESTILPPKQTVEISSETRVEVVKWLERKLEVIPDFKCVVWCRWVPEIESLLQLLKSAGVPAGFIYGKGETSCELLHPTHPYVGPLVLVAQPQAARYGRNFSKADTAVYLSRDYDPVTASQSEDRIQAPGQLNLLLDVLVTGPDGQKTITWDIRKQVLNKVGVGQRTASEWKRALED